MIPEFDANGYLPAGEHLASWAELRVRFGWNSHRLHLLEGMLLMAQNLRDAGVSFFLVDGSFVTAKQLPSDYDACCDFSGANIGIMDWDLTDRDISKLKYGGEVFPDHYQADNLHTYRDFFQRDRAGTPKGIVRLRMDTLP
jgi:hypothetical protein